MKKLFNYLRSMRFGILLLCLIALFSVAGSLIPQERALSYYAQTYQAFHGLILMLQLNRVFTSWYFVLLLVLLCLNLTLCSLVRVFALLGSEKSWLSSAARLPDSEALDPEELARLEQHLSSTGCRRRDFDGARVYFKHRLGRYGSFVTHLAILLTVLFGAAALYLPQVTDLDCMPGEALTLDDGTRIEVDAFSTRDLDGRLEYRSRLRVTLPDGRQSDWRSVRVNYPMSFGPYKIYQQTYGTAGSVTVTNLASGGADRFYLSAPSFISLDNANGLFFIALYPDYRLNSEGELMLLPAAADGEGHPVYYVQITENGAGTPAYFFPGDSVTIAGLSYEFHAPTDYPGLRIKHTPVLVNALLIVCFALMIAGLFITFFLPPVLVKVDDEGYAVGGPKPEGMRIELRQLLHPGKEEIL